MGDCQSCIANDQTANLSRSFRVDPDVSAFNNAQSPPKRAHRIRTNDDYMDTSMSPGRLEQVNRGKTDLYSNFINAVKHISL